MLDWSTFQDPSLIQGSEAWRKARRKRIGGQAIASIMQIPGAFQTRRQLWEFMTGRAEERNISNLPHIKNGREQEVVARAWAEKEYEVTYTTPVVQHEDYPQMVASLDGLCDWHTLEIKTMTEKAHRGVLEGDIHPKYLAQCQWGMLFAKREWCLFLSIRNGEVNRHWIVADKYTQRSMLAHALVFWRWITRDLSPPDELQGELF